MSHPPAPTTAGPGRAAPGFLVLLIASGTIISLCMGLRQSLGLFMRPMTLDLGVSAATFGFSIALQNIVWGLSQPVVGALADRHGPRPVLIATSIIYAAGLALMVVAGARPGGLAFAGFLIGIGIAGTGFGVLIGAVSRATAPAKRTQTVGIVAAAGSLGTVVIAPAGQVLIGSLGWRPAMLLFAAVAALLAVVSLAVRDPGRNADVPTTVKQRLGDALAEALTHRGYLFMMAAFFACGFQLVFIATYLPSYLDLCGVAPGVGATALALIGLFNTIGTYAFGLLGARFSQRRLLALIYLLRTLFIAAFLLVPASAGSALVFASAMGMLWLGVVPLVTGVIGRVFGLGHFNTLYGIVFLSHQLGSFCGALMGGMVFDRFGNYNAGWGALIAVGLAAFLLQWSMDERPPRRRLPAAPPLPEAA
ncbi:MAG: MFS transporter [Proteobacteria bacterium]|jgi:predicted MFS family arabinose efflux permease|nr:MFS transporter [Pseudomonadota bacterium]